MGLPQYEYKSRSQFIIILLINAEICNIGCNINAGVYIWFYFFQSINKYIYVYMNILTIYQIWHSHDSNSV